MTSGTAVFNASERTRSLTFAAKLPSREHRRYQIFPLNNTHHESAHYVQQDQDHEGIRGIGMGILDPPYAEESYGGLHHTGDRRDRQQRKQGHHHCGARRIERQVSSGIAATQAP
jgi:hypothetical protein